MKNRIWILVLFLLLSACTLLKKEPPLALTFYDLGPAQSASISMPGWSALNLEMRMPLWMATASGVQYRLLYQDRMRLHEYATARWAGTPAELVRQRLQQQLGLPLASTNGGGSCRLIVDINEFIQVFSGQEESHGLVAGEASLFNKSGQRIANRRFNRQIPVLTQDASGGVTALANGVDSLATEISDWLQHLPKDERTSLCRVK